MNKATNKSRQLNDLELSVRLRSGCPHCSGKLVDRICTTEDLERGGRRYAGQFFGCSNFGRGCNANYSVNLKGRENNWRVSERDMDAAAE